MSLLRSPPPSYAKSAESLLYSDEPDELPSWTRSTVHDTLTPSMTTGGAAKQSRSYLYAVLALTATFGLFLTFKTSWPAAFVFGAANDRLAYRAQLEQFHGPHNYTAAANSTFGFEHIYVVSLETAVGRRAQMSEIAAAQAIDIEMFDAVDMHLPVIDWIADRVVETREARRPVLAKKLGKAAKEVGGGSYKSIWLQDRDPSNGFDFPQKVVNGWEVDGHAASWVEYMNSIDTSKLHSNATTKDIQAKLFDPIETYSGFQISAGTIACFHSHIQIWHDIVAKDYGSALIMEDDIDLEWDMDRLVPNILRALPEDWDIVYLGHCWTEAETKPKYLNPIVRKAAHPLCTHGYALSRKGAQRMLETAGSPWTVYSGAVDTAMVRAHLDGKLSAFVVDPPIILQAQEWPSSIQGDRPAGWRGLLMDSTLDRIKRSKGETVKPISWNDTIQDHAVWES